MILRRVEQSLWIATSLIAIGTIIRPSATKTYSGAATIPRALDGTATAAITSKSPRSIDSVLHEIISSDVFRRERNAAEASLQASASQPPATRPPAPSRPHLILRGLVGGPPWDAILDGIPGHDGSYVVRAGDSVGGLKIRSVRRDGAVIRGMDTMWVLTWGRVP